MKKQDDMRNNINDPKLKYIIGDVNYTSIYNCRRCRFCFSCCSFKTSTTCEFHPIEAVKTNILGTENVISIAIEKVKKLLY